MSKQTELAQVADTITVNSGNVGIGTSSPDQSLTIGAGGKVRLYRGDNTRYGDIYTDNNFLNIETSNDPIKLGGQSYIRFDTNSTERMRLDASGNLIVGETSTSAVGNGTGAYIASNGQLYASSTSSHFFNRKNSNGNILTFRKDGSTVGGISYNGSGIGIYSSSVYTGLGGTATTPYYWSYNLAFYPSVDNSRDLGTVGNRFDDVYATNGTIQTSDRNEKQDIEVLSEAEQRVAVACKGLLRKFRWKDAVAEKGDEARTHFGIIAQDLQAAFAAEGLDAGDYAMFISSTWTDEETGEERTRMGVRYSELLAFIIAAI